MPARIDRARQPLHVDVSVGDPVTPAPTEIEYPALLGESFAVMGYPIDTVLAEKIVTIIDRGDATTRERDFADVVLLIRNSRLDAARVTAPIVATRRPSSYATAIASRGAGHAGWRATRGLGAVPRPAELTDHLPASYAAAVALVASFADPILTGSVASGTWDPLHRTWRSHPSM